MGSHQRLKQLREKLGLTQKELADVLGIQQSSYAHIERGKILLTYRHLEKLHTLYQVNIHWLLTGEENMFINHIKSNTEVLKTQVNFLEEKVKDKDTIIQLLSEKLKNMEDKMSE